MGEREPQDRDAADAREQAEEVEEAKKELRELEEGDPPEKLEDWPDGKAKYLTYGGPEGTSGYDEGERQLRLGKGAGAPAAAVCRGRGG